MDDDNNIEIKQKTEDYYRINAYNVIVDTLITRLRERFSTESLSMGLSVDNFFKLNYEESLYFIDHYQVSFHINVSILYIRDS